MGNQDVSIGAKLSVNTGNSAKSINDIQKEIKAASAEVKAAKIGTDAYAQALARLKQSEEDLKKSTMEQTGSFALLKSNLANTVPALKGVEMAGGGVGAMLKLLAANPLVLILVAIVTVLKGLYEAFKSTFEGGQKVEQVFAGIGAAVQVVWDRIVAFAGAVIKFFSGDFKGALKQAKEAVSGIGDEISRVYNETAKITKRLQELKRDASNDEVEQASRERRRALLREQLNDEDITAKKKIAIAKELSKDVQQNAKEDYERNKEIAELEIRKLEMQKDGAKKNLEEINKWKISLYKSETENAMEGVRVNKLIRSLEKQDAAERKSEHEERKKQLEELKKLHDEEYKAFLKRHNDRIGATTTAQQILHDEEIKIFNERKAKEEKELSEELSRQQKLLATAKNFLGEEQAERNATRKAQLELDNAAAEERTTLLAAYGNALNALSDLIGQQTVVGKGLAIAASLINTYQGVTKALAQGGILGFVTGAAVLAAGLTSVKKIASVQVPGNAGGAGVSVSGASMSAPIAPVAPTNSTTTLDSKSIQQLGQASSKSFVLDADIKSNRERDARINRAARIG